MKAGEAIAKILKKEGVEVLFGYPVNHLIEYAAAEDMRTVIVRQERVGAHMADALSRMTCGQKIGVFVMQHGPGSENAFGGVAQAFSESVPLLVMPMGYARRLRYIEPNFNSVASMRVVTKSAEAILSAAEIPDIMRRAFSRLRNGRGGPALVEIPIDIFAEDFPGALEYEPVITAKYGPDPAGVREAAKTLVKAKNPTIYAGQGVHYAQAWDSLKKLAELLGAPVATSLQGKSAFPEDHPLSAGAADSRSLRPSPIFSTRPIGFSVWAAASRKRHLELRCRKVRSSSMPRSIRIT